MNRVLHKIVAGFRIDPIGVAMPGPQLPQRIHRVMGRQSFAPISGIRGAWIVLVCTAVFVVFAAGVLVRADDAATHAQTQPPAPLSFEVASVKLNKSGDVRSPSMILPGGRFTATNNTVRALILKAYGIFASPYLLKGGPGWIDSERYDVDAKASSGAIPAGTSNRVLWEKTRLMLQTLLADRFKLSIHRETKEMASYELLVAKNGPKLQKSDVDCNASATACHGFSGNPAHFSGIGVDMYDLALMLSRYSDRPVVDHTGIQGLFDIRLQWNPFAPGSQPEADAPRSPAAEAKEGSRPDTASLPILPDALEQQVGLRLEPNKGPIETYVIDHIEEPTSN
ncbi:MAG TPA: TIGR03435 family protein [Candidatus Acidoferrales bacterium]|nr:TIGR03435 family protein [Candidatus Acidoferrales bacterium]